MPVTSPTHSPFVQPSAKPTIAPHTPPSKTPISTPTTIPTTKPRARPTMEPLAIPTLAPTMDPTKSPLAVPTHRPTEKYVTTEITLNRQHSQLNPNLYAVLSRNLLSFLPKNQSISVLLLNQHKLLLWIQELSFARKNFLSEGILVYTYTQKGLSHLTKITPQ